MPESRSEQLGTVGVAAGCVLVVMVLGAVLVDWLSLRWTIVLVLGTTLIVMLGVIWATRTSRVVAACARCNRPARSGLYCAFCGAQHRTEPPRVLDDVSIEISGGITSVLVPYGTPLPFTKQEVFSTASTW